MEWTPAAIIGTVSLVATVVISAVTAAWRVAAVRYEAREQIAAAKLELQAYKTFVAEHYLKSADARQWIKAETDAVRQEIAPLRESMNRMETWLRAIVTKLNIPQDQPTK